MRSNEIDKQLEDLQQRLLTVIEDLKELRAKVAETTEGVERQAAINRLMAEGVWS